MDKKPTISNSDSAAERAHTSATSRLAVGKSMKNVSRITGPAVVGMVITTLVEQCKKAGIQIQVRYSLGQSGLHLILPEMTIAGNRVVMFKPVTGEIASNDASNGGEIASNGGEIASTQSAGASTQSAGASNGEGA